MEALITSPRPQQPQAPPAQTTPSPPPTIDLRNPHRPLSYRLIRALHRPRPLHLDALRYSDELDPVTRAHAELLIHCVEETAALNGFGRMMFKDFVQEALLNRHQIAQRSAGRTFAPVEAPIVILGLPRSGSTYLFNLLGATRRFRTLRNWETHKPASTRPVGIKKLEAAFLLRSLRHFAPGMITMHEQRLEGPEECTKPLLNAFVSQMFPGLFHIPRYNDFLDTADYLPTYELYRRQLQILGDHGKRWLLKSPMHIQSIDRLLEVFPDATFIHLQRDFRQALGSTCSLSAAFRCLTSDHLDGKEIGAEVRKFLARDLAKARTVLDAHPQKVLDLPYKDFVTQPVQTVRRIFDFAHREYTDADEHAVRAEMQVSIPHKFGKHIYRTEDYL